MSRETSPYIISECWLDKRRDGKAPKVWQIARAVNRSVVYRSTHCRNLDEAKAALDAHVERQKALERQEPQLAQVIPMLMTYWQEHGRKRVNHDQTARSLRTFIGFLSQDPVGARAVITDLTPSLFERFREWRMGPHGLTVPWSGESRQYGSDGVSGATVQRNVNDVRAAVKHAEANLRISAAPKIRDVPQEYQSPLRERILTTNELARIAWYCSHNPDLFRFVALQLGTAIRPMAAHKFDPRRQYDDRTGLINQQPEHLPQTKKRNAVIPAIRPIRPVLRSWAEDEAQPVASRKTAWRVMRRALCLSADVYPKTIRHTVATLLYLDDSVPERQIVEILGHEGKLARTTRIYAKYDPTRMKAAVGGLERIWLRVSREARRYSADHLLTTTGQGGMNVVVDISAKR